MVLKGTERQSLSLMSYGAKWFDSSRNNSPSLRNGNGAFFPSNSQGFPFICSFYWFFFSMSFYFCSSFSEVILLVVCPLADSESSCVLPQELTPLGRCPKERVHQTGCCCFALYFNSSSDCIVLYCIVLHCIV